MPHFICTTCATQFAEAAAPPPACPICEDERQYVPARGQGWTTLPALQRAHSMGWREVAPNLLALRPMPALGIDQRALLLRTPAGNVLWDCLGLLDPATVDLIKGLGGLAAIAISHPHYYGCMVEWSRAFNAPVWLHTADQAHVMRPDAAALRFWEGEEMPLLPGVTLHRLGGHFAGATVLHWADGEGALLCGDILQVLPDRKFIGFMRSYPCLIPLPPAEVARMAARCAALRFEAIYGAFHEREIVRGAQAAIAKSATRYAAWVQGMVEP